MLLDEWEYDIKDENRHLTGDGFQPGIISRFASATYHVWVSGILSSKVTKSFLIL